MRFKVYGWILVGLVFLAACSAPQGAVDDLDNLEVQGSPGVVRQMVSAGTTSFRAGPLGAAKGIQDPEFSPLFSREEDEDLGLSSLGAARDRVVNRSPFKGQRSGPLPQLDGGLDNGLELQRRIAQPDPALTISFEGLNLFQQRFANSGNQFTIEPPDQALCVGNGFVLESVNDVLRVFDNRGKAVTGVIDLNTFYNYPPAIDRSTITFGPSITDPVCYYDQDTRTWFHVVLTLDVDPTTGDLIGTNHLDIAVSKSADPDRLVDHLPARRDQRRGRRAVALVSATILTSARTPTAFTSPPTASRFSKTASTARSSTPSPSACWLRGRGCCKYLCSKPKTPSAIPALPCGRPSPRLETLNAKAAAPNTL